MRPVTLLALVLASIFLFLLMWDADRPLRECMKAGKLSDDVCFATLNP